MANFKTVIFDLDDTLYEATAAYRKAEQIVFLELAPKLGRDPKELATLFSQARSQAKARLPKGHSSIHNRVLYFKRFCELLGKGFSPALFEDVNDIYEEALLQNVRCEQIGRIEALAARYRLAIITDEVASIQSKKLRALTQGRAVFGAVIISEEFGVEKPAPVLYEEALRQTDSRPQETLMVGDDWKKDIEGAVKQGLQAWWIHSDATAPTSTAGLAGHGSLAAVLDYLSK